MGCHVLALHPPKQPQNLMLKLILSSLQLLPLRPLSPLCQTRCRRIEKKTEVDVLVTQKCVPTTENVCTKETVETEEIEYEKVCQDVVSKICDAPAAVGYIGKREAEAETDPQYVGYAAHAVAPVAATAVAHSVQCHCQVCKQ